MGPSIGYKDAKSLAEVVGKSLSCPEDFVVRKRARIIEFLHMDGTYCKFASACFKKIADDWMAIYTEHHGTFVYHTDDLEWVRESRRPKDYTTMRTRSQNEDKTWICK